MRKCGDLGTAVTSTIILCYKKIFSSYKQISPLVYLILISKI